MFEGTKVIKLGKQFEKRLPEGIAEAAIDYVRFNESPLAIETLCDRLYEYSVPITAEEFQEIKEIVTEMEIEICAIDFLEELIIE